MISPRVALERKPLAVSPTFTVAEKGPAGRSISGPLPTNWTLPLSDMPLARVVSALPIRLAGIMPNGFSVGSSTVIDRESLVWVKVRLSA